MSAPPPVPAVRRPSSFGKWLMSSTHTGGVTVHHREPWWKVMCLTGVDYFSTLGYQPESRSRRRRLSPSRRSSRSRHVVRGPARVLPGRGSQPHGQGSILMIEELLPRCGEGVRPRSSGSLHRLHHHDHAFGGRRHGAHHREPVRSANPAPPPVLITLLLVSLLAAVFLKGFRRPSHRVGIVAIYLVLNVVVIGVGLYEVFRHPTRAQLEGLALPVARQPDGHAGLSCSCSRSSHSASPVRNGVAVMPS